MLPVLRTGEAIILGEAVQLPVRTQLEPPDSNMRPDSSDPLVYDANGPGGWNRGREPTKYEEVVAMSRKQDPKSPSIKKGRYGKGRETHKAPVHSKSIKSIGYDAQTL